MCKCRASNYAYVKDAEDPLGQIHSTDKLDRWQLRFWVLALSKLEEEQRVFMRKRMLERYGEKWIDAAFATDNLMSTFCRNVDEAMKERK